MRRRTRHVGPAVLCCFRMTLAKRWKRLFAGIAVLLVAAGALTYYLSDKLYLRFEHTTVAPG